MDLYLGEMENTPFSVIPTSREETLLPYPNTYPAGSIVGVRMRSIQPTARLVGWVEVADRNPTMYDTFEKVGFR
jgi:hypothetical protein